MPNEFCQYLEPNYCERWATIKLLFSGMATIANHYGYVHTDGHPCQGATVWFPPGTYPLTHWQMLRAGLVKCPFVMGLSAMNRLLKLAHFTETVHAHLMQGQPYWYLLFAGVAPERQGQGIGTELVTKMHDFLDAMQQTALLEANNEQLVSYWERFGYTVQLKADVPVGGVTYWFMVRQPNAG
ncbi:MAG: GNAT family N-acetyltransferase [Caldilineaceae bacterium]